MKSLTSPVTIEASAVQSGFCELYDIYLSTSITTPFGSTNVIRLTTEPEGMNFFKPQISPETDQGTAIRYEYWPIKREIVKADTRSTNDKMRIQASNVTTEWAQMLAAVSWYDVPIIIRKVPLAAGLTADDCAILWSGAVDSVDVSEKVLTFECSSDLAMLNMTAPRENMHTLCRFQWADDQCTKIRFRTVNYKSGTVGNSSTGTVVKSSDLSEDGASAASYGTDLVNALSDGAITTSSEQGGLSSTSCAVSSAYDYIFVDNYLQNGSRVEFGGGGAPGGITFGTLYYVINASKTGFQISTTLGGSPVNITSAGSSVNVTSEFGYEGFQVKSSKPNYWSFATAADWGTLTRGFYQIPDAQAGLANEALKPYIQFDFGSAKTPRVWRISSVPDVQMEELVRLIVFFSSTDNVTWRHETYFELPPKGGVLYDVLIPAAQSARYWRICIRTRWATSLYYKLLNKVYAYENARHYWARGRITFASNTSTTALRGVSRRVLASYSGEVHVPALPATPANGDTFVIERGCGRSFNDCCARLNWENFGGFTDLPFQAVVR